MNRLNMDKKTAESLVKHYGPVKALALATARAESAMTDERETHWQNIAIAVKLLSDDKRG